MNARAGLPWLCWLAPAWALAQSPAAPAPEFADEDAGRARWEAGVVVGGGRVPDYPGADQSHTRGLVAPVFIYRGPILRVDPGGIRGRLLNTPDWRFDLSGTAAFNARNNEARAGMPGLDYLFGVGPQLVYKGLRHAPGAPTLHLKARAVMSTDFHRIDGRGATFDPELRWRLRPLAGSTAVLTVSVQPTWASRSLQQYFYEVPPNQATPTRPAYSARAGYLGTQLALGLSRRVSDSLEWFVSARALSLHGAANADSPLMRASSNFSVGAGVVWTPWRSAARASE
jgi:outer membrane protein